MAFYILKRDTGETYAMNIVLSDEEAQRYGHEGETVPVRAVCVWTTRANLENFKDHLLVTEHEQNSPFTDLVRDMRAGTVSTVGLSAKDLREQLRKYRGTPYVLVDSGPGQEVREIEEFLTSLAQATPRIIGPPQPEFKMRALERAVGKTISAVEFGEEEGLPEWKHEGEAIVLHFTDGTALSILVGSNAKNLSYEYEGLEPGDIHTDLTAHWVERLPPE
jgi:hypothetical protein